MHIALLGYGKMGKVIEKIALERGHTIAAKVTSRHPIEQAELERATVAIEFSRPEMAVKHITHCIERRLPVVVGTTGWYAALESVEEHCRSREGALLYATNFSLGVHLFFEMNRKLAQLMASHPDYRAAIVETHHTEKKDAPSGTAISTGEDIVGANHRYTQWIAVEEGQPTAPDALPITAVRSPDVPGTHQVSYTSTVDTIDLVHTAHNRNGFGQGSVVAAEWLVGKQGVFTMNDVLNF